MRSLPCSVVLALDPAAAEHPTQQPTHSPSRVFMHALLSLLALQLLLEYGILKGPV
jgi:hypothetical protein